MTDSGVCARAERLVEFATENGWGSTLTYNTDAPMTCDVTLESGFEHPDLGGWHWGVALRWYCQDGRWTMGNINGKPVAGIAEHTDGRELDFRVRSVAALKQQIVEPADLATWLESASLELAPR